MSILIQILIVASYGAVSLALAVSLPQMISGLDREGGLVIGAGLFLLSALAHEMLSRNLEQREIGRRVRRELAEQKREIEALREVNRGLIRDFERAREQMSELADVVESAAEGANNALLSQMEALQFQLGQLSSDWPEDMDSAHLKMDAFEKTVNETDKVKRPLMPPVPPNLEEDTAADLIQEALEENRVDLYLQPIVSLPQRKTRFYEAYARLRTADNKVLMPEDYATLVGEKGLMGTIDNLLLFRCVQLVRRAQRRKMDVHFFINVSSHTVNDAKFLSQFIEFMMSNYKLSSSLIFEFDYDDFVAHDEEIDQQLQRLAGVGFKYSVDKLTSLDVDFRTLARRNIRYAKIPASLLLEAAETGESSLHPLDIREVGDRAGIDLICNKIETERQVVEILDYQFDFGQGYLFGEPRPTRADI